MRHLRSDFQLDWDTTQLHDDWAHGPDGRYLFQRLDELTVETALAGGARRVLDVAAAEAAHSIAMRRRGVDVVALDPSPAMLAAARQGMAARGVEFALVRGIGETLPFRDGSFDRVLCHSAIDHVADPDLAVREMTRVLTADGRLVISAVNYRSASARLSRLLYRARRGLGLLADENDDHQAWDSPVPAEHTFECSLDRMQQLCGPYLELERTVGVSMGWGVPGWNALLARWPPARALAWLRWLDERARRTPALADFVYAVWRPRPRASWPVPLAPEAGGFVVQPNDLVYPFQANGELAFWNLADFDGTIIRPGPQGTRWANRAYTGDPERSWLDDLIARGPFRDAAVLGCDEEQYEAAWLRADASPSLDVYELSPYVIGKVRRRLGPLRRRARFVRADLNFAALPAARYDIIWSSGCLHHIVNLEHLLGQVERALRPGGLFAVHDYIGERRMQFAPARLARVNALLAEIPLRYRRNGITAIAPPDPHDLSPFCGVRPAEILPLAAARFETVHCAAFGSLFPLPLVLDIETMGREDPALLARLQAAEAEAGRDPATPPCSAYAVFRKR